MPNNPKFLSVLLLSFLFTTTAYALPSIVSLDDKTYEKNSDSEVMQSITITDDATEAKILTGEIKITIPDAFQAIFDTELSLDSLYLYGEAIESGKVDTENISFEDNDKSVVIQILEDFEVSESFVVQGLYLQGFHKEISENQYLTMTIGDDTTAYTDTRFMEIDIQITPALSDDNAPDVPSDIQFEMTDEGILITWEDPTDLDLNFIQVLRGADGFPVDASNYITVGPGTETHLDTDVSEGDEMKYILRSSDGRNVSGSSQEYVMVYNAPIEEELVEEEEAIEEETEEELVEEEEIEEEIEEEQDIEVEPHLFDDVVGHWGEAYIESLYVAGVVSGNDDGTFGPDKYLNRAELAKMLVLAYTDGLIEGIENPYDDVSEEDWYVDYAASAHSYGIMTGEADGSFNGAANVNRATLMQAVYNAAGLSETGKELPFTDVMESDWFYNAVDAGYWLSIVNGEDEDTFNPSGLATRAAAAKVIYNGWYAGPLVFEK